jgi:hypothetical protein
MFADDWDGFGRKLHSKHHTSRHRYFHKYFGILSVDLFQDKEQIGSLNFSYIVVSS